MSSADITSLPDSLWAATAIPAHNYPKLEQHVNCDVCIVGGGFTGLSAALHLAENGTKAVVLESAEPGWGASGRNGGQVIPGLKLDPDEIERMLPPERAERLIKFAGAAPDRVFDLIEKYNIECHAERQGWIQPAHCHKKLPLLESRIKQWQTHGVRLDLLDKTKVGELLGTNRYAGGLLDHRGGKLQPLSYTRGLAAAAESLGASLFAHSPAQSIQQINDRWRVHTGNGSVTAHKILLCTNAYTDTLWPGLKTSVIPVFSYQVATEPLPASMRDSVLPKGHVVSDTRRLLIYFRTDHTGRLMVGGRGRFKDSSDPDLYQVVVKALHALYPQTHSLKLEYYWGGQVALTMDHFPHLHELADGVFAGLGFNGRGVAMATAMGKALADRANGQSEADSPLPASPLKTIPMHGMRKPVLQLLVGARKMLDAWEMTRSR